MATGVERVAVVGAGCAGSVAAWKLAEAGLRPVLFERSAVAGENAACGGMMLSALARRLDLPDSLVECEAHRVELVDSRGRRRLRLGRSRFVGVERPKLDALLAERAAAAGARLRCGSRVVGLDLDTGRLSWTEGGREHSERFDTVLFADGPRSVAATIGLGPSPNALEGAAFFRELASVGHPRDGFELRLTLPAGDAGYLWVFPRRDHLQVGIGRLHCGKGRPPLRRLLDEQIAGDEALRQLPRRSSRGGLVPLSLARRVARPGALVVGDAAGLVNPVTGGGLVYAVASGELAARVVAQAVGEGRDPAWVSRRYSRALKRSVHYRWLWTLGRLFALTLRCQHADRDAYPALLRLYLSVLPVLSPMAQAITAGGRHGE